MKDLSTFPEIPLHLNLFLSTRAKERVGKVTAKQYFIKSFRTNHKKQPG